MGVESRSAIRNLIDYLKGSRNGHNALLIATRATVWLQATSDTSKQLSLPVSFGLDDLAGYFNPFAAGSAESGSEHCGADALMQLLLSGEPQIDSDDLSEVLLADHISALRCEVTSRSPTELAEDLADCWSDELTSARALPPVDIVRLMFEQAQTQPRDRVHCMGMRSEFVAIQCMRLGRVPVIVSPEIPYAAIAYALLTGAPLRFEERDPLSPLPLVNGQETHAAVMIWVPEFGIKAQPARHHGWIRSEFDLQLSESLALEHAERHTRGIAVVFTSNRVLSSRGREEELRRHLVIRNRFVSVTTFPGGLLSTTAMPFAIIVLDTKNTHTAIVFCGVDAAAHFTAPAGGLRTRRRRFTGIAQVLDALANPPSRYSQCVSRAEIERSQFVLAVDRYLNGVNRIQLEEFAADRATLKLEEVALVIKSQTLRSLESGQSVAIHEVVPSEFPEYGYLKAVTRLRHVDPADSWQSRKQILVPGDVLLSTTGSIGRTAIAKPVSRDPPIFASHSTVVLRLRDGGPILNPVVLFMYLRSPFFQSLLRTVEARTVTPHVSVADVRSLPVIVPTAEQQHRLIELFEAQARLGLQIDELERTKDQLAEQEWSRLGLVDVEEKKK
jgi:hypothetical protein